MKNVCVRDVVGWYMNEEGRRGFRIEWLVV